MMNSRGNAPPYNPDPVNRRAIEQFAVDHAIRHYRSMAGGERQVIDVSKYGCGWDLEASAAGEVLKIEVKGLADAEIVVELTPNEYDKMRDPAIRPFYVIYIVTECLTSNARAHVFRYIDSNEQWECQDGLKLQEKEKRSVVLGC
jgi:Domain of unknown function (DUF3883)